MKSRERLPRWMKVKMPKGENYSKVKRIVSQHKLHTICTSGKCPNIGECWGLGTATFMILGDICTRSCKFCGVKTGKPLAVDRNEVLRVAESVKLMKLSHCVITSVDRDDLADGGAEIWALTIREVKRLNPGITIETLIPDFQGNKNSLDKIIREEPDVISHNLETVERLTPKIRSGAKYSRSLEVLKYLSTGKGTTKSGIMLGLGETEEEILKTMDDLLFVGCQILTLGQYLAPGQNYYRVKEYIHPEKFDIYKKTGLNKGFLMVESSPLVRSSYHAEKHVEKKTV